ncbi:BofC C-terminal domain-containing protein [Cohnella nanjingensis]|uniref:BofC C-terminal domain-containing protein n=1 Tax=Cohnella nanjingensis TaxID=1387779 RepID=A0A7X0VHL1_9BACL|nr:BofC C-terminal domain-containing protein [Cohnella nanjingensis]MBB6674260.1 BofC C-terminal domain-containing protein [Cohnella nanjingensis]
MFGFRIKELKKRLKRHRRPILTLGIWTAAVLTAVVALALAVQQSGTRPAETSPDGDVASLAWSDNLSVSFDPPTSARGLTLAALASKGGDVEVVLHRAYLCGDETRKLGRFTTAEAIELLKAHREWTASFDRAGRVVMEEAIDDLSPICRETAYIGLDRDGNLSLFDGPPRKEKVIRTFFQLDVKSLESGMSKERMRELTEGIRVTDRAAYNHVLTRYGDYALNRAQGVMKRTE